MEDASKIDMTEQVQQFFANGLRTIFPVNEESFRAPRNRRHVQPSSSAFLDRGNARLDVFTRIFPQWFRACGFESGKIGVGRSGRGRKGFEDTAVVA